LWEEIVQEEERAMIKITKEMRYLSCISIAIDDADEIIYL
jgi:hypothetical protein